MLEKLKSHIVNIVSQIHVVKYAHSFKNSTEFNRNKCVKEKCLLCLKEKL